MRRRIETTEDGSHTLYVPELDEHYHSTHGAVQESLHVYLREGFLHCNKEDMNLLEIGFGTGLNAFLTLLEAEKSDKTVCYTAIEKYPLSADETDTLNYPDLLEFSKKEQFTLLHTSPWGEWVEQTPGFRLKKLEVDIRALSELQPEALFDLIYYDAFAPDKQPSLWTQEIFDRLYALSAPGAVLTTYCAKGAVRRMLQSAGYLVERLPGPPGKREMLRAVRK